MKIYIYETHDYMDMYPEKSFGLFESQEQANAFIEHMRSNWNSGTVSDAHLTTPEAFTKLLKQHDWSDAEIQEWLDKCDY